MTWVIFWHKIQIEKPFKNESYVILKLNELRNLRVNVPKDTTQGWVCPKDFSNWTKLHYKIWTRSVENWQRNNEKITMIITRVDARSPSNLYPTLGSHKLFQPLWMKHEALPYCNRLYSRWTFHAITISCYA